MILPLLLAVSSATPDSVLCAAAARFLREDRRMEVVVERDTIDDWRTGARTAGCRITAGGTTATGVAREAAHFYERVRAAGWVRTPDPRDAPREASLRFRRDGVDCLFNVYEGALLFTDAELRVSNAVSPAEGELRYQVLVLCVPARDARPAHR